MFMENMENAKLALNTAVWYNQNQIVKMIIYCHHV